MKFLLFVCLIAHSYSIHSQNTTDISFWSDVMINANSPEHRQLAVGNFQQSFAKVLEEGAGFEFDFSSTPELTVLSDTLNSFKLISWQIQKSEKEFDYFGYIVHQDGSYFPLDDGFESLEDIEYTNLNNTEWLGGIYYNMIQMGDVYYVFSYRQLDKYTKFKSFDVLSFEEDGRPLLGAESFVFPSQNSRDVIKNRITFKYSAEAIFSLNYNPEMKMVVHDHLMQVMGQMEGQGPTMVPDGTYEGYALTEGKWIYKEKLFSHTYDEAPRPMQILGKSTKDVFGRARKN